MIMQHKKSSEIIRENLTYMLNQEGTPSMRNLSTSIGTSDSYIQKILNQERTPSLDKIDSISEFFDVESWEMFYNFRKDRPEMLTIMQQLNKLPPALLPTVKAYLDFLLAQQDELLSTKKISSCQGISYNFQTSALLFTADLAIKF
jgi:transcriptional regulator with XRE-family HTH domain